MNQRELQLTFEGLDAMETGQAAASLMAFLEASCPNVSVRPKRTNPDAQDMGATLVLLFGTPALVALAQGIKSWMEQRDKGEITIKTEAGEIVARGLSGRATREAVLVALKASVESGAESAQ